MISSALFFPSLKFGCYFFGTIFLDAFSCLWGEADFLETATEMFLFQEILLYFLYLHFPFLIKVRRMFNRKTEVLLSERNEKEEPATGRG